MEMLGKIPRSNKGFAGYEEDPAYFDEVGKQGIKFRQSPDWLSKGRPFTVGNTVFVPPEAVKYNPSQARSEAALSQVDLEMILNQPYKFVAGEELPHVAQYRQKGLMGFLGQYLSQMISHRSQENLYSDVSTLEGFHHGTPAEKKRLQNIALRK